jgi:ATP-binding cassette subfamily B protein/subfamily B ATP-binding cassette protein MsbA
MSYPSPTFDALRAAALGTLDHSRPARERTGRARREYLSDYLRWLWPHRWSIAILFALALAGAGLEMIEPLFMRFIVDRVLLVDGLDASRRIWLLNLAGAAFLAVITISAALNLTRDYRQRLVNTRVMLSLRNSLFDRLVHLPLARLHDMKTGGVLSRLTGDIDSTTGLLQLAIVSPSISVIRLAIAVTVLIVLNWQLALVALAIVPGAVLMSFVAAKRIRPIYRSIRKDVERIDGGVGETFSGIRVVRAFRRELREMLEYARGRLSMAGRASIGDIMAFQWYSFLLLNPVWQIVNSFSELQRSLAATERVLRDRSRAA